MNGEAQPNKVYFKLRSLKDIVDCLSCLKFRLAMEDVRTLSVSLMLKQKLIPSQDPIGKFPFFELVDMKALVINSAPLLSGERLTNRVPLCNQGNRELTLTCVFPVLKDGKNQ